MRIGFEQPDQPPLYYNILDIIGASHPPKLISPRDDYRGSEGNSLRQDEVLLVKGVHVAKVRRSKFLIVVSVKTSQEKRIPSDCPVAFSTEPTYNQVRGCGLWQSGEGVWLMAAPYYSTIDLANESYTALFLFPSSHPPSLFVSLPPPISLQLTLGDLVEKVPELIPGSARLYPTVDVEDMGFPGQWPSPDTHTHTHTHTTALPWYRVSVFWQRKPSSIIRLVYFSTVVIMKMVDCVNGSQVVLCNE